MSISWSGFSQESDYKIVWRNQNEELQAGTIYLSVHPNPEKSEFRLGFRIVWLNASGRIITEPDQQPLLYLSEYDIETPGNSTVFCKTFTDSDKFDLYFSDTANLIFAFNGELRPTLELRFKFQYAFSEAEIFSGKTRLVDYPVGNRLIWRIPANQLTLQAQADEKRVVDADPQIDLVYCMELDSCYSILQSKGERLQQRIDALNYQSQLTVLDQELSREGNLDSTRIEQIREDLNRKLSESGQLIADIDELFPEIREVEKKLIPSRLPADSLQLYQARMEALSRRIKGFKGDFLDFRVQIRSMQSNLGVQTIPNDLEEQRELLIEIFQPSFGQQVDSINAIRYKQEILLRDLNPKLLDLPSRAINNLELDSLINLHYLINDQVQEVRLSHRASYMKYLDKIGETGPIGQLESQHLSFENLMENTLQRINQTNLSILELERKVEEIKKIKSYRPLWIGGSLLFIVLVILLIRTNRKRVQPVEKETITGSNTQAANSINFESELIGNEVDCYTYTVPDGFESVIEEVNFSFRAIQSMNQIVQGALSKKMPLEFGGYFFGRQYRAVGQGQGQFVVIVDQVVASSSLRFGYVSGVSQSEDLVDEMDQIVSKNRKLALLGWFAASGKDDFEMKEDLVKLHRTFFRDKWQIAMLINPATDNLQSALYLRRKSGFFETNPGPECQISLDELYQYALNPPFKRIEESTKAIDEKEYKGVVLNQNWCDSIVQKVSFHESVIESIFKELEEERMRVGSHIATGFFYGIVEKSELPAPANEFMLYVNRFVPAVNGDSPRELPGVNLLGWLNVADQEVFESLRDAIPYHQTYFPKSFQIAMIINSGTREFRIFSQKHNLELNNNVIETEEFNLNALIN